jgi:hypothetical protein
VSGVPEPIPEPDEPHEPDDLTSEPDRAAGLPAIEVCPLCGTQVGGSDMRCPRCNRSLAGVGNRPGPFSRRDVVLWVATIAAIYVAVMLVVYAAR